KPFQYTLTRPVDVRVVVEDYVDETHPEHRRPTDIPDFGQSLQVGNEWVGDLIFDDLRTPPGPFREYNHLIFGKVRNGVNLVFLYGIEAKGKQRGCHQQHKKAIAQ